MAKKALKVDEIGYWSEVKLEIIRKYAHAYSTIMSTQRFSKGHLYIDAFAGAGTHLSKTTGRPVEGSPLIAWKVAGFDYVPAPMPMRNSRGAVVYYLCFASPNPTGAKIVREIFEKYRGRGTV